MASRLQGLCFAAMGGPTTSGQAIFKYPLDKPPDGSAPLSSAEKVVSPSLESYKEKLLNLFGEVAAQKIHETSSKNGDASVEKDLNMMQQDLLPK